MSKLWSEIVRTIEPYVAGEQPKERRYIKLNTNENPYGPSPKVAEALRAVDPFELRLYPDPESYDLRAKLAGYFQVDTDEVFVGNGSDEVLALAFMAFFQQKQPILFPSISYSFYPVYCDLFNIDATLEPLSDEFELDLENYSDHNGGIIFPNPNAPTGRALPLESIEKLLKRNRDSVVVVDEAYIDFGGESAISLTKRYNNLLVVQTFSKSRSLAGMRVGYAIGNPILIDGLKRVKDSFNSYPIDRLASIACIASIEDEAYFKAKCHQVIETREWTSGQLSKLGFKVIPSHANFIFAKPEWITAEELYSELRSSGILVRYFAGKPRVSEFVRVTIGTKDEMESLVSTVKKLYKERSIES